MQSGEGQGFDVVTGACLEAACCLDFRQEFRSVAEDDGKKKQDKNVDEA